MSSVKEIVDTAIKDNRVVIFSKSWCSYSRIVKELFNSHYHGEKTEVLELDKRDDGEAIQQYLLEKTKQRTVPNVFVNQKHIGGCDTTMEAHKQGELTKLLANNTAAA